MTDSVLLADDDLFQRTGLPARFRYLEDQCARAAWPELAIHPTARRWLQVHDWFRGMAQGLVDLGDARREGRIEAVAYRAAAMPRLRQFLGNLEGHHHHESEGYFPALAAAEPAMRQGFELLDRDHEAIHALLAATAEAAVALNQVYAADMLRSKADALAGAVEALVIPVRRHLLDEEEIVVPVLTLRGDPVAGV
jgi:hypothetical protein